MSEWFETVRKEIEQIMFERDTLQVALTNKDEELKCLRLLNETLTESLRDRDAAFSKVMNEQCPSDEHHCTCVPALRAEIAQLRVVLSEIRDQDSRRFTELAEVVASFGSLEIAKIVRSWAQEVKHESSL
jgi:hypothetical protein